jgi:hypothetical protein
MSSKEIAQGLKLFRKPVMIITGKIGPLIILNTPKLFRGYQF